MVKYSSEASSKDIWIFGGFAYSLVLFIVTCVYAWIQRKKMKENVRKDFNQACACSQCMSKDFELDFISKDVFRAVVNMALLLFAWFFLALIVFKIQSISSEDTLPTLADPFELLGITQRASLKQIKTSYRKLLVKHHPDHGGDPKMFMDISNAYKILTDEASREKWEKYGNLDGPTQHKYGIALPIWLINDKTPPTIIVLYYLFVLIGIPGLMYLLWKWCFPGKPELKAGEPIIGLFYRYFKESSLIPIKRLIIIISACPIFDPDNMKRRSIHLRIFPLITQLLTQLQMNKELTRPVPFNSTYSIEARSLIWSQLSRLSLKETKLYEYQSKVLTSYRGILGMILHEITPLWRYIIYENQRNANHSTSANMNTHFALRMSTVENCIKLCGCIVQALQISDSNLLMLPHITNMDIARLQQKKKNIKNIIDYIKLTPTLRTILMSQLDESQRHDFNHTLNIIPLIEMNIRIRCDDDTKANAIIVNSLFNVDICFGRKSIATAIEETDKAEQLLSLNAQNGSTDVNELKSTAKKGNKKVAKKRKSVKFMTPSDYTVENISINESLINGEINDDSSLQDVSNVHWPKSIKPMNHKSHLINAAKIQAHCPLFPTIVCESWWIYITLDDDDYTYTPTLQRTECIENGYTCFIQGEAPPKAGVCCYTIHLISDVYHNLHFTKTFHINIVEDIPIDTQHHWDISSSCSDIDLSIVTDEEVEVASLIETMD